MPKLLQYNGIEWIELIDPDSVAVLASRLAISEVLPKIPTTDAILDNLLKQSDKIVSGLELRIDDIKDLKDKLEEIKKIKTTRQLFGGGGFNYGALLIHQVDDETPTNSGDDLNFTIAHAPNPVSSLKLYRNGQRLKIGAANDYTFSGITITLLTAKGATEILTCDYQI